MLNTSLDFVLKDIRDYFASCAGNAQNGSAAFNRFNLYKDAISAVIKDRKVKPRPTPDDPFMLVLISAVRYCLGRRTYMPDVVTRWIMASVPELPANTAKTMLRDINDQRRQYGLGDDCDVKTWETFESWLQGRLRDGV